MTSTPIFQAPADSPPPHAYVVRQWTQRCACGATHEWTEIYAKTHYRRGNAPPVTNLRHCIPSDILYDLPIIHEDMGDEQVPFCHRCYATVSLAHLPKPTEPSTPTASSTTSA